MFKIGIDIGGTKIHIGLFDAENKSLLCHSKSYVADITLDPFSHIAGEIQKLCREAGIEEKNVLSCGIGIPGTVSTDGTRILKVPNIAILSEDFGQQLQAKTHIPTRLVQDSRAAAWGEYFIGGGKGYKSVVCVTLGTGIGTGIVLNGKIYDGALGCAGELGHLPVQENGRPCGCGKNGCLEKYCAGGGLDITAKELFGENKTASDLFEAAKNGDVNAKNALQSAIEMLGGGLVAIINLLSPDCVLFSGGLSAQEDMYLNPVIDYIKAHCYATDTLPILKKADLGDLSPLYGAAFLPIPKHRKPYFSASIMCADVLNMGAALAEIKEAGIHMLHCDIMDNHFVPNLMMPMEFLNKLRPASDLPFDFHIMAENPESVIEKLEIKSGDIISVHWESTVHLQKVITLIKEKGAKAAVALNPATPLKMLDEVLPQLDMVLIMTVNPGFAGQKIVPESFEKIQNMRKILQQRGLEHILLQVDGNCSFENVPKMYDAGADIFVVGTSSVFRKEHTIKEGTEKLRALL
ncbi:MAG: ribulose-phosphate 3-epimerase [Clostridia bacterium]|nr:ribulose-phosphate 3-epimerase [Clostridia bacterium]